jgi:uncharacterized membrane protein HdeD (DUF308 family)
MSIGQIDQSELPRLEFSHSPGLSSGKRGWRIKVVDYFTTKSLTGVILVSLETRNVLIELHRVGLQELKRKWGWFVGVGGLLVVLGTLAAGSALLTTMATVIFIGSLMLVAGLAQVISAFSVKGWGGFFIDLLSGVLYAVTGFLVMMHPAAASVTLTLLIALMLIFGGIFRIVLAAMVRFPNWGWMLLHGLVTLALGISIWNKWPADSLWVIGLFVGIDMIFNGWSLVMLGFAARNLPLGEERS